jgi:FkbM family methyltransferase
MRDWIARRVLKQWDRVATLAQLPVVGPCVRTVGRYLIPERSLVWTQIQGGVARGLWIELNPRTGKAFYEGSGEPAVQQFLSDRIKPGMVFYDLGANCGFFSLIAACKVADRGQVYCFEPEHELAERIRSNLQRNGFAHCEVVEAAAWNCTGSVSFVRSDRNISPDRGTGHVTADGNSLGIVKMAAIALDDFIQKSAPPDFIKCDVEGAEVEVFNGAAKLLASRRPIIVCEIHTEEAGRILRSKLAHLGYSVVDLDGNHIAAEVMRA